MAIVLFRGGKFDGRKRDFGKDLMPVIELQAGHGKAARYMATGEEQDGMLVYALADGDATALPYTVHFSGGPFAGKGRHFAGDPQPVLIIPLSQDPESPDHGWFARYKRADQAPRPGQPLLYDFVERFEGER